MSSINKLILPAPPAPVRRPPDMDRINAWVASIRPERNKEVVRRLVDGMRYVPFDEFRSRVKLMAQALNPVIREFENYTVVLDQANDFDLHKSKRWVFGLAYPWLEKDPASAIYQSNEGQQLAGKPQAAVIFDDFAGSGMDLYMSVNFIKYRLPSVKHIFVAIPFLGSNAENMLEKLTYENDYVQLLHCPDGSPAFEVFPRLQELSGGDLGEFGSQFNFSLAYFDHKFPDGHCCASLLKTILKQFLDPEKDLKPPYKDPGTQYYAAEKIDIARGGIMFKQGT
jgi:hypothetical protein